MLHQFKNLYKRIFLVREIKSKLGVLHFRRWRVIETPLFNIYLHAFYKPDSDSDMHDHPWDFMSIIIWNGYYELVAGQRLICRDMFYVAFNKAEKKHTVVYLHDNKRTYTFVITGPRRREWGYHTSSGWMTNQEYRKFKNDEKN
jgi:hypothetical protein